MGRAKGIVACLTLVASVGPLAAQSSADRLGQVLERADFSGAVLVSKGGEVVFEAGKGMADRAAGRRNTPETQFRIGSVTKQFTAMAVLILQDRGRLDVKDPVGRHVPGLPEAWRRLTIHQLLTHTSGLMHSWALPGFRETMARPTTLDQTLARFFEQPLLFEPGSGFQYSGVGYFLLAKLIEQVSGQSYGAFLRAEVFEPLGMKDTGADDPSRPPPRLAQGYDRDQDGSIREAAEIYVPLLAGGGDLHSTVGDLARWDRALASRLLVSERAYAAIYRPERESYAYGWRVGQVEQHEALSHSGGLPGFSAYNLRLPADGIDVIVLSNHSAGSVQQVALELAKVMLRAHDASAKSP
ncbi:MAG: serine hydrolase domain-containing protein [Gemmatimonadales bacterium]